jgi:fructose/tagatose bisphosphate aldolase
MPVIAERQATLRVFEEFRERGVCMAVLGTASHWNTEAILLAAKRFGERHGIESPAVSVAITFNYPHMPQAQRVTRSRDPIAGFRSIWAHLKELCGRPDSPYASVRALPHLDHAHPERDEWALTEGIEHLASVMFDAQEYPLEKNRELTARYVREFGDRVVVEGNFEGLAVATGGAHGVKAGFDDEVEYAKRVGDYVDATGVDLMVADLGTEQQSTKVGGVVYRKDRARAIAAVLGGSRLVLHGTSSLSKEDFAGLEDDGIIRTNMWTRIAREAGQAAAEKVAGRIEAVRRGDFESADSRAYLDDAIDRAADVMEETLDLLGYRNFGTRR